MALGNGKGKNNKAKQAKKPKGWVSGTTRKGKKQMKKNAKRY